VVEIYNLTSVYITIANPFPGARQLGWASCLASAGRVLTSETFLEINALARLTGTTLGVACRVMPIKEVKIKSAKPTVIE